MTPLEIVLIGCLAFTIFMANVGAFAAYRNGVTDGYGYAKEPTCPGYRKAGEYLRKNMAHRWPELTATFSDG